MVFLFRAGWCVNAFGSGLLRLAYDQTSPFNDRIIAGVMLELGQKVGRSWFCLQTMKHLGYILRAANTHTHTHVHQTRITVMSVCSRGRNVLISYFCAEKKNHLPPPPPTTECRSEDAAFFTKLRTHLWGDVTHSTAPGLL